MQAARAATSFLPSFLPGLRHHQSIISPPRSAARSISTPAAQCPRIKLMRPSASASPHESTSTVDYSSVTSVFPAEACEIVGGEACDVKMYPEVKLTPDPNSTQPTKPTTNSEKVDIEYLDYNTSKTVFPGEACDDLGGEFCEPEYQTGVY